MANVKGVAKTKSPKTTKGVCLKGVTAKPASPKRVAANSRYKKIQEKTMFLKQYYIYGEYVSQEEKDIDRAVKSLDNFIRAIK